MSEAKPKKSRLKKLLKIFLGFILFVVLLVALLPFYSSLFTGFISQPVGQQLDRSVNISGFSLNLFGGSVFIDHFAIKEDNGKDDFLSLQEMEVNVSVLSLIRGALDITQCRVKGLNLKVAVDEQGRSNFDSIIQKLAKKSPPPSQPQPSPPPSQPQKQTQPLEQLPEIFANLQVENCNFHYTNAQSKTELKLDNLQFHCEVAGLNKIVYQSKWDQLAVRSWGQNQWSLKSLYELSGKIGVSLSSEKELLVSSEGKLRFHGIEITGLAKTDLPAKEISLDHKVSLNLAKQLLHSSQFQLNSDYLKVSGKIPHLGWQVPQAGKVNWQSLSEIDIAKQQADFSVQLDLDKIQADWGAALAEASQEQLHKIGGQLQLSSEIKGEKQQLKIKQAFDLSNFSVAGAYPHKETSKNFAIKMAQLQQELSNVVSWEQKKLAQQLTLTAMRETKQDKLLEINLESETDISQLQKPVPTLFKQKLGINLDEVYALLGDFFPEGVEIAGKISNEDTLKQQQPGHFLEKGNTNIVFAVKAPEQPELPPLKIAGKREIKLLVTKEYQPQQIEINHFDLSSQQSNFLNFKIAGKVDFTRPNANIQSQLLSQFSELNPYIAPFAPDLRIKGSLKALLKTKAAQQMIQIRGGGVLKNFAFAKRQAGDKVLQLDFAPFKWYHDIDLTLENKQPATAKIARLQLLHPALQVRCEGSANQLSNPQKLQLENIKLTSQIFPNKLPKILLEPLQEAGVIIDGHLSSKAEIQGTLQALQAKFNLDLTPLQAKYQRNKEVFLDKQVGMPIVFTMESEAHQQPDVAPRVTSSSRLNILGTKFDMGPIAFAEQKIHYPGKPGTPATILDTQVDLLRWEKLFPILPKLGVEKATLTAKIDQLQADFSQKQLQVRSFARLKVPYFSLLKLDQVLRKKTPTGKKISPPASAPETPFSEKAKQQQPPQPLLELSAEVRKLLKGVVLDMEAHVDQVELDAKNEATDFYAGVILNREQPDNQLLVEVKGELNKGNLHFEMKGDLSSAHPEFQVNYDIVQLPYLHVFEPIENSVNQTVSLPIWDKVGFAQPTKTTFNLKGGDTWRGIDPRAIKRSLRSTRENVFQFPKGEFDLGYQLPELQRLAQAGAKVQEEISKRQEQLAQLRSQQQEISEQAQGIEKQKQKVSQTIEELRSQKDKIMGVIEKLEPLAAWNPVTKRELEKAKQKLNDYDSQLQKKNQEKEAFTKKLQQFDSKLQEMNQRVSELEKQVQQKKEQMGTPSNPFSFAFDNLTLYANIENSDPWTGQNSALEKLQQHPYSKVLLEVKFDSQNEIIPYIHGKCDLEGDFSLQVKFAPGVLEQMNQSIPGAGKLLKDGLKWTPDGIELIR